MTRLSRTQCKKGVEGFGYRVSEIPGACMQDAPESSISPCQSISIAIILILYEFRRCYKARCRPGQQPVTLGTTSALVSTFPHLCAPFHLYSPTPARSGHSSPKFAFFICTQWCCMLQTVLLRWRCVKVSQHWQVSCFAWNNLPSRVLFREKSRKLMMLVISLPSKILAVFWSSEGLAYLAIAWQLTRLIRFDSFKQLVNFLNLWSWFVLFNLSKHTPFDFVQGTRLQWSWMLWLRFQEAARYVLAVLLVINWFGMLGLI